MDDIIKKSEEGEVARAHAPKGFKRELKRAKDGEGKGVEIEGREVLCHNLKTVRDALSAIHFDKLCRKLGVPKEVWRAWEGEPILPSESAMNEIAIVCQIDLDDFRAKQIITPESVTVLHDYIDDPAYLDPTKGFEEKHAAIVGHKDGRVEFVPASSMNGSGKKGKRFGKKDALALVNRLEKRLSGVLREIQLLRDDLSSEESGTEASDFRETVVSRLEPLLERLQALQVVETKPDRFVDRGEA